MNETPAGKENGAAFAAFASSLLSHKDVPAGVINPRGGRAEKRYAVYRNNVAMSLTSALADIFPVTRTLVGPRFFAAMAQGFIAQNPPCSPVLAAYGRDFPAFIEGFAPARKLFFLPDVARLERAWLDCYHAADRTPLPAEALTALTADALAATRLKPHPAARLLPLGSSAVTIFNRTRAEGDLKGLDPSPAETALITRPDCDVAVRGVSAGQASFLQALFQGETLGDAAAAAQDTDPGFDLPKAFELIIATGAFAAIQKTETP